MQIVKHQFGFYIATNFANHAAAKALSDALAKRICYAHPSPIFQDAGCSFPWWETIDASKGGKPEAEYDPKELAAIGSTTLDAITHHTGFLVYMLHSPSIGACMELGMAYAAGVPIILLQMTPEATSHKLVPFLQDNCHRVLVPQDTSAEDLANLVYDAMGKVCGY